MSFLVKETCMDGGNNLVLSWKAALQKLKTPITASPKEKLDCRKQINHFRGKSWGANERMTSLKGDLHLSVKEKGPAFLGYPAKRGVCGQLTSRGDNHGQTLPLTAAPAYMQRAHVFSYLRKTHCYIWWNPKCDDDNLVDVQREGPEHYLGLTVNGQRKHRTKDSSYCSETIHSWQHGFCTRKDWADPFLNIIDMRQPLFSYREEFCKHIKAGQSVQGRALTCHMHTKTPSKPLRFCHIQITSPLY